MISKALGTTTLKTVHLAIFDKHSGIPDIWLSGKFHTAAKVR